MSIFPKKSLSDLPEVFVSDSSITKLVSRELKQNRLRKLSPRVYTKNLREDPKTVVQRNLWPLVAALCPGGLIADRTALEMKPSENGIVFLITDRKQKLSLPGLTIQPRKGHPPLDSDREFIDGLRLSSPARAYLENIRPSRSRGEVIRRTLTRGEIEESLEKLLRFHGESALQRIRDEARSLAPLLNLQKESTLLDQIIGALLGTKNASMKSEVGRARLNKQPYDPERLVLFETLHRELKKMPPVVRYEIRPSAFGSILPFFEAYFSNFIEGTEFEVHEAQEIIFNQKIPSNRPDDAHDIIGTFKLVGNQQEMERSPRSLEEFFLLLTERHRTLMSARVDRHPGEFKKVVNRAGSTYFVSPELVEGTLTQGFGFFSSLESPFSRAVFMMFLISEVHPFEDGNGRTARVFMNAELVQAGESRIIIPTVYRNNYLSSLRALTHNARPEAVIRVLEFAQRYTAAIDWSDMNRSKEMLRETNAFMDAGMAEEQGLRLRLPDV